jgi:hypothetical protein
MPVTLDDDVEHYIPFLSGANLFSCPPWSFWSSDENVRTPPQQHQVGLLIILVLDLIIFLSPVFSTEQKFPEKEFPECKFGELSFVATSIYVKNSDWNVFNQSCIK